MHPRSFLAALFLLIAVVTIGWLQLGRTPPSAVPPDATAATERPVADTPPVPVLTYGAPDAVRAPSARDRHGLLELPNGDFVPALNGVLDAPAMTWPIEVPYSPIIGRERDTRGQDWYVHANGARSTTSMVFRSDEGRLSPVTSLALPKAPAAILDGR